MSKQFLSLLELGDATAYFNILKTGLVVTLLQSRPAEFLATPFHVDYSQAYLPIPHCQTLTLNWNKSKRETATAYATETCARLENGDLFPDQVVHPAA